MDTIIYVVQNGDTLWKLAKRFGTTIQDILRYNHIADPDAISINQIIKIPVSTETSEVQNAEKLPLTYIVQSGDVLWKIAKRFGLTTADLINMNALTNPDMIYPGQVLVLKRMK
ncbi:MAG: LysM peptidoglycan-binding domain-containing protein [Acutalibacteraceae bacterium]